MQFTTLGPQHLPQVEALWDYCFEKRGTPFFDYYFTTYAGKENTILGALAGDKLQSMLHLNPYTLRLGSRTYAAPYIVGVATAPEARGRHLMGELLRYSLTRLHTQGTRFVTLMPIYAGIYQPYDFAYCYQKLRYTWDKGRLTLPPLPPDALRIVPLTGATTAEQRQHLAAVYDQFTAATHGTILRNEKNWQQLLTMTWQEGAQIALAYDGEQPCGYLFYTLEDKTLQLYELVALRQSAKRRLLTWAEQQAAAAEKVIWTAEPWDRTFLQLADQSQSPQLAPFIMARCLDAKAALQELAADLWAGGPACAAGTCVLRLTDSLLPHNNCTLALTLGARLQIADTALPPDLTMDIGTFTQLLFGAYTAAELAGKMTIHRQEGLTQLTRLFPQAKMTWHNEYV